MYIKRIYWAAPEKMEEKKNTSYNNNYYTICASAPNYHQCIKETVSWITIMIIVRRFLAPQEVCFFIRSEHSIRNVLPFSIYNSLKNASGNIRLHKHFNEILCHVYWKTAIAPPDHVLPTMRQKKWRQRTI